MNHFDLPGSDRSGYFPSVRKGCFTPRANIRLATKKLTVNQAVAGLHVADDADCSDGEHAAQAEDVAAQAVVDAGDLPTQPGVVEGGHDGERVEADAAQEVHHGQVDAQQLGAHHLLPPAVTDDQDQPVPHDREQN